MAKILFSLFGAFALLASVVSAAPAADLAPAEAVKLIAMRSGVPLNTIQIPFIVAGNARCGKDFEVADVRRVAAIHGVRDGRATTRRLVFYDFFWNEALGWFLWESRQERAGEAVFLWSERRGEIVNR